MQIAATSVRLNVSRSFNLSQVVLMSIYKPLAVFFLIVLLTKSLQLNHVYSLGLFSCCHEASEKMKETHICPTVLTKNNKHFISD